MAEQESVHVDAQRNPDGSVRDEPPYHHETRPHLAQPTPELRWTKAVIRGHGKRHEPRP
jgi:hypothetical protein